MRLFYVNKDIVKNEHNLNFDNVIEMLEKEFEKQQDVQTLTSLIGNSWYYFIEGDIGQSPTNYNSQFFLEKWKYYIDIGLNRFYNNLEFCLIAGYTLMLHGFYIDLKYEHQGVLLLERCIELNRNSDYANLARYWLANDNSKKYPLNTNINTYEICKNLFQTDTLLEKYFYQILKGSYK